MEIKYNIPLAKFTSYKVGGKAKIYFKPNNLQELQSFIKQLPKDEKILWLGLGSNVLIRDGGFDGIVIHIKNVLNDVTILNKNNDGILIKTGAGVSCSKLAKFCLQNNLGEGIWFAGIPGSIGGALAMNAGAFKGETWEHVKSVEIISQNGEVHIKYPTDYKIGYRSIVRMYNSHQFSEENLENSSDEHNSRQIMQKNLNCVKQNNLNNIENSDLNNEAPTDWFISANLWFNFTNTTSKELQHQLSSLLQARKKSQPIGTLNCGSVFKNPNNNTAGLLIEAAKLKGTKLGNAVISEKHANFIINLGQATATDIESLIKFTQDQIFTKYNIMLEPEVKIIGKPK